jgi:hypothetical protein
MIEPCDAEDERRRELRMLEKERDWKRVVRILASGRKVDWRSDKGLACPVGSLVRGEMMDDSSRDWSQKSNFSVEIVKEFRRIPDYVCASNCKVVSKAQPQKIKST